MIGANGLTRCMTINLPPSHPIRRLLTVFTFNTNKVNNSAQVSLVSTVPGDAVMSRERCFSFESYAPQNDVSFSPYLLPSQIPERSMVHHATAFTYDAILKVFDTGYKLSNIFEPFPERKVGPELKKMCDRGEFPFYTEGSAWFNVVKNFVKEWLKEAGDAAKGRSGHGFLPGPCSCFPWPGLRDSGGIHGGQHGERDYPVHLFGDGLPRGGGNHR